MIKQYLFVMLCVGFCFSMKAMEKKPLLDSKIVYLSALWQHGNYQERCYRAKKDALVCDEVALNQCGSHMRIKTNGCDVFLRFCAVNDFHKLFYIEDYPCRFSIWEKEGCEIILHAPTYESSGLLEIIDWTDGREGQLLGKDDRDRINNLCNSWIMGASKLFKTNQHFCLLPALGMYGKKQVILFRFDRANKEKPLVFVKHFLNLSCMSDEEILCADISEDSRKIVICTTQTIYMFELNQSCFVDALH